MSRRVLITGGTGFVGSHAVEHYLAAGWTVRALVRDPRRLVWLKSLPIEIAVGTMTDQTSLEAAVAECDVVVHCAGLTKTTDPRAFFSDQRPGGGRVCAGRGGAGGKALYFVLIAGRGRAIARWPGAD